MDHAIIIAPDGPMAFPPLLLGAFFTLCCLVLVSGCRRSQFPDVKGPKPVFFFGNLWELLRLGLFRCLVEWQKQFGNAFKICVGASELLLIADAGLVRELTVKSFPAFRNRPHAAEMKKLIVRGIIFGRDKAWSASRGAALQWFHKREHLEGYLVLMTQHLDRLCATLSSLPQDQAIDIEQLLLMLTLDVICSAMIGASLQDSVGDQAKEVSTMVVQSVKVHSLPTLSSVLTFFLPDAVAEWAFWALSWIPFTQEHGIVKLVQRRSRVSQRFLETRLREEQAGSTHSDLLADLLRISRQANNKDSPSTSNESTSTTTSSSSISSRTSTSTSRSSSMRQQASALSMSEVGFLLEELMVAGSDTTATTIAFAIFLLQSHPGAQSRVLREIDSLWGQHPPTTLESLEKYEYVGMVVKEVLRMYPAISQVYREAQEDTAIGSIRVPKGGKVMFHVWLIHHDSQNFPDPDSFNPDRFDPHHPGYSENNLSAYMPFGDGPRMCLGYKFAVQQITLTLIKLYKCFTFDMAGQLSGVQGREAIDALPIDHGNMLTLKNGLYVHVRKRALSRDS